MRETFFEFTVSTDEHGRVVIEHPSDGTDDMGYGYPTDDDCIVLHPEQVDQLIKLLQRAQQSLQPGQAGS